MEQLEQRRRCMGAGAHSDSDRDSDFSSRLHASRADYGVKASSLFDRAYTAMFDKAKAAYSFSRTPSLAARIRLCAQWLDAHMPAHCSAEIVEHGMEAGASAFYGYGGSFIHGDKWMTENTRGGPELALIADALAVSVNMVESAVCLYEAATRSSGVRPLQCYVPEQFEPTIAIWSAEHF